MNFLPADYHKIVLIGFRQLRPWSIVAKDFVTSTEIFSGFLAEDTFGYWKFPTISSKYTSHYKRVLKH